MAKEGLGIGETIGVEVIKPKPVPTDPEVPEVVPTPPAVPNVPEVPEEEDDSCKK